MHDILLDATGDLPPHPRHARGPAIIAQAIRARLLTFRGEWLIDTNVGVPYLRWTQDKPVETGPIRATLLAEVEAVAGVVRVEGLEVKFDNATGRVLAEGRVVLEAGAPLALEFELAGREHGNTHPYVHLASASGGIVS